MSSILLRQTTTTTKNPRVNEHEQNTQFGLVDKSKIAEHNWSENNKFNQEEAC